MTTSERRTSDTTLKARALGKVLRLKDKLSAARDSKESAIRKAEERILRIEEDLFTAREEYKNLAGGEDCPV